jgi:hypothetical protein
MGSQIQIAYMEDVKYLQGKSGRLQNGWGRKLHIDFSSLAISQKYRKGVPFLGSPAPLHRATADIILTFFEMTSECDKYYINLFWND